ncbi:MAG: RluA family pseudouridine synthase [Oligoflexia bacterium]|nr:RluA family pseudouridine synthase [Oligoflexia bacterium]
MIAPTLLIELKIAPGPKDSGETRLDILLLPRVREQAPRLSRAGLKELFRAGAIRLEGRALAASERLGPGTYRIAVTDFPPEALTSAAARPAQQGPFLPMVFEDDRLLVLDKRSGVASVPHSPDETETAVGAALAHHPALAGIGRGGLEPGLLHRLDTGTSGLLAFAKTEEEFARLRRIWSQGEVIKTYRAIVSPKAGSPSSPLRAPQELHLQLAHDPDSAKRMVALLPGRKIRHRGKPLESFTRIVEAHALAGGSLDLEIQIRTGVMHQIRCTLAALGWPIEGDQIYRGAQAPRLWLHAWRLGLPAKEKGAPLELEAPLPENWPR